MRRLLFAGTILIFLMVPMLAVSQSRVPFPRGAPPPVAAPLVREGDFAMKLVETLKLGTVEDEAEAESILGQSGIAPRNGWISDYPVTPDVIKELEMALTEAAVARRLPMTKEEALKALRTAAVEVELPIIADVPGGSPEGAPPSQYADPSELDNYYNSEGPPVVTYYPPPPDYTYLYAWVPSPFYCSGFFFSGFFILHDFHKVVIVKKRPVVVTNHVFDRKSKRLLVVDPERRATGRFFRAEDRRERNRAISDGGKGGRAIFERSRERASSGSDERRFAPSEPGRSGGSTERRSSSEQGGKSMGDSRMRNESRPSGPSFGDRGSSREFRSGGSHGGSRCTGRC